VCNNLSMAPKEDKEPGDTRRAGTIRARIRAEMTDEIKATARRHLETEGANLSLRAVARDVGMVSSAVYRYFASRDDLLTALIVDAYNAVGEAVEQADAGHVARDDLRGRFLDACRAVRTWGLAHPAEYALLYGSPVPGYAAPGDTVGPAARTPMVLVRIVSSAPRATAPADLAPALAADLARLREMIEVDLDDTTLMRAMTAWIYLFGLVSFELFGQLNNMIDARDTFFDAQMGAIADQIGL